MVADVLCVSVEVGTGPDLLLKISACDLCEDGQEMNAQKTLIDYVSAK